MPTLPLAGTLSLALTGRLDGLLPLRLSRDDGKLPAGLRFPLYQMVVLHHSFG